MITFLDSGVLLTAWRGKDESGVAALKIIDDRRRVFVTAQMVRLELLPKPTYFGHRAELEFYGAYFGMARKSEPLSPELADAALALATQHGLAAADALNMAAALRLKADEFVTTEAPGKALFRVPGLKVTSLHVAGKTPVPPVAPRKVGSN